MRKYVDYLIGWIQSEVRKTHCDGVIVGISGGIDSAVVACLAKKAFPDNSLGIIMPINNMGQDFTDAKQLAEQLHLTYKVVDLVATYESATKSLGVTSKLALANIKPRLRMMTLYAWAQEKRYLVLGTDNAAEWILGYFTKYGDGGVDLLPIVQLTKGQVYEMARFFNVPQPFLVKAPSAQLWENQTDEAELGFTYASVDAYLMGKPVDAAIKAKIERQIAVTAHKRQALPQPLKPVDIL